MPNVGRLRRRIAVTATTGIIAAGLVLGGTGVASPSIARVIELVETPAESPPATTSVELQLEPRVDVGELPRIVAIRPGAAISNDARRPDGPDSPPSRRRVNAIPESDAPKQGIDGTQPDPPAKRPLPAPTIAPQIPPAPPSTPDILPAPASPPALDLAPAVTVPPDQPGDSLRPDPPPAGLTPDAPPR